MINWPRMDELRAEFGQEDLSEIVELFLVEVEETLDQLSPAMSRDFLLERFHYLKGSAYNLGFDQFGDLCSEAEKAEVDVNCSKDVIERLVSCFAASKAELAGNSEQGLRLGIGQGSHHR